MYDAREKALRDRKWEMDTAKKEGEIKLVRTLQELLGRPVGEEEALWATGLEQLQAMAGELKEQLRSRMPSSPES